jgi:putative addiction module CopG family antidote
MSVAFPPDIESFVTQELSAGEFASRDELIVAAVDLLRQRKVALEKLKADIARGFEGEGIPAEQVFAQLRAKYTALADAAES